MSSRLPELVDPWRLADARKRLSGRLALARLGRLGRAIVGGEPWVQADLGFLRDERNRAIVTGRVKAELELQCQRCLEPVSFPVDLALRLAVVENDAEAARLPDEIDPLLVDSGRLHLADMIEDELLLALPQVPMHDPGSCPAEGSVGFGEAEADAGGNPFAALAELKRRDD
jgi:uncharacterized protein